MIGRVGISDGEVGLLGLGRGGCGILIVRAQPADEAALFIGGPLVVEGDEAGEELSPYLLLS